MLANPLLQINHFLWIKFLTYEQYHTRSIDIPILNKANTQVLILGTTTVHLVQPHVTAIAKVDNSSLSHSVSREATVYLIPTSRPSHALARLIDKYNTGCTNYIIAHFLHFTQPFTQPLPTRWDQGSSHVRSKNAQEHRRGRD